MAFNHPMPELYKKTFSDEKKRSDHSRKKENGGKKEKFSSWVFTPLSLTMSYALMSPAGFKKTFLFVRFGH